MEFIFFVVVVLLGLTFVYNVGMLVFWLVTQLVTAVVEALTAVINGLIWLVLAPFRFVEWLFGASAPSTQPPATQSPPPKRRYSPPPPPPQEERYTKDWPKIARREKQARGWRCSECNVYCGQTNQDKRLLHVHHIDLDSKNNNRWNLAVLCVECHAARPGTGHKRLRGAIDTDGRLAAVRRLRGYPMWS